MNNPFDILCEPVPIGPVVAQAVCSGHLAALEHEETALQGTPFRVKYIDLEGPDW